MGNTVDTMQGDINGLMEDASEPRMQSVTFILNNERYGIEVMIVQEVLHYSKVIQVPGAPNYIIGIINLRGSVVVVIDLRKRLAVQETEINDSTRIIIIENNDEVIGLLVDSVSDVVEFPESIIEAPRYKQDPGANADLYRGVAHLESGILILLDIPRLFANVGAGADAEDDDDLF